MANLVKLSDPVDAPISLIIRRRLQEQGVPFMANDNIASAIHSKEEMAKLLQEVESKVQSLLESLVIDTENDHNTQGTAHRVAKMYLQEVFKGRYLERPPITDFPNVKKLDEIYTIGPISLRSACSHHFVPIIGNVWVGVLPSDRVIGISKFNRLVDWVASRPHIQEEFAMVLADTIEELIQPKGLVIVIKAQHLCMTWRGVRETQTHMVNSVVRGVFSTDKGAKAEFFELIRSQGF